MNCDRGRIQAHRLDANVHQLFALQLRENAVQHAALGPAVHARVDGVPRAETLGQAAPLAAVLGDIKKRVKKLQMGDPYIAARTGKTGGNTLALLLGDLHVRRITHTSQLVLTRPSAKRTWGHLAPGKKSGRALCRSTVRYVTHRWLYITATV